MEERSRSIVEIKRSASPADIVVASVLITEGSVRVFSLMQSDYIQLNFSLGSAVYFEIGDYVDDEIFGRFVVTSHQMPNYNVNTGGYDYTLKLDKEYRLWANKMFMLTTLDQNQQRIRKENDWCLTDKLSVHLEEVIHNLTILGYNYSYQIENTAEHAQEVKYIQYTNKDILSSLTAMANEWQCEWWVEGSVIHLGKCETVGSLMDFELGVSVESMTIQKNVNKYLNKIFAYGSTQNIPFNYRKKLIFDVKDITTQNGMTLYGDTARPITEAMGINTDSSTTVWETIDIAATKSLVGDVLLADSDRFTVQKGCMLDGNMLFSLSFDRVARYNATVVCQLLDSEGNVVGILGSTVEKGYERELDVSLRLRLDVNAGVYTIHTECRVSVISGGEDNSVYMDMSGSVYFPQGGESKWCNLYLEADEDKEHPYKIIVNPLHQVHTMDYYGYFVFDGEPPTGFTLGSKFFLDPISYADVPASYYSVDYDDPSALAKLGESRLELPESTGGYLITDPNMPRDQIVESVVLFNDTYPHAIQKVAAVESEQKESKEEQQDGSKTTWTWIQYMLTATLADGNPFQFSKRYIQDGMTLQIKFITKEELEKAGYTATAGAEYRLAGMTFDVQYDEANETYAIVRNETYGAKLPNDILRPTVGDPFVLINWNVKIMEDLGLIDIAENELQAKAQEYLDAIEQGQFTFTCNVMSRFLFGLTSDIGLYAQGAAFYDSDGKKVYVKNDGTVYILPTEGQPVRVIHGALKEPKVSRVIGYQFKLDRPYDTPQYTIGETQAFSRLAQIEKEITKLQ